MHQDNQNRKFSTWKYEKQCKISAKNDLFKNMSFSRRSNVVLSASKFFSGFFRSKGKDPGPVSYDFPTLAHCNENTLECKKMSSFVQRALKCGQKWRFGISLGKKLCDIPLEQFRMFSELSNQLLKLEMPLFHKKNIWNFLEKFWMFIDFFQYILKKLRMCTAHFVRRVMTKYWWATYFNF